MSRYYDVEVIYKAGLSTRVYAMNEQDAKNKAIKEVEMACDHIETLAIEVTYDDQGSEDDERLDH